VGLAEACQVCRSHLGHFPLLGRKPTNNISPMPPIKEPNPLDIGSNAFVTLNYLTLYKCPHGPFMSVTSFLTSSKFYQTI